MKKLLVVSAVAALGLASVAFAGGIPEEMPASPAASEAGFYIGVEGGWGMTHWGNIDKSEYLAKPISVDKDQGIVGRGFLGFDLNRYFAIEAGYSYFFNKVELTNAITGVHTHGKTSAIDLLFKGKLPVVDNFDLFAKLGGAYLMTHDTTTGSNSEDTRNFCLAFGAGADYYITPNVIVNLEWLRYEGHPKLDKDYQPNTDALMIGLRYRFDI